MAQDDARPDTIASPGREVGRSQHLGLAFVGTTLAVAAVGSMWSALHYREQAHRLQGKVATSVAAGHPSTTASQASQLASSSPAQVVPLSPPPLTVHSFEFPTNDKYRVTVYLTTASTDGGVSTEGQVLVTALVHGTSPGQTYRLSGGDCDNGQLNPLWAEGVADARGTAFLTGQPLTLPKTDNFTMELTAGQAHDVRTSPPGMNGLFVLGQAAPYFGHACN